MRELSANSKYIATGSGARSGARDAALKKTPFHGIARQLQGMLKLHPGSDRITGAEFELAQRAEVKRVVDQPVEPVDRANLFQAAAGPFHLCDRDRAVQRDD